MKLHHRQFPVYFLVLSALFSNSVHALLPVKDFTAYFAGHRGCLVLQNVKTGKVELRFGDTFCADRQFACSTFKVPLAAMATEHHLIQDENTFFKWDGKERQIPAWNKDQTAKSWMADSVVWVSQQLTPRLGLPTLQKHLKDFSYGNQDMSGGLTEAWLSSSLKISPVEQAEFLRKLWTNQLNLSPAAVALTQKLTYVETFPNGTILHGKTGSGFTSDYRLGWYVGHIQTKAAEYVFALDFVDNQKPLSKEFAGREARTIFRQIATDLEWIANR